jgi:adenine-specific DNA-methyltransferase
LVDAFDWEREFPTPDGQAGFDAVVGNPPWGAEFTDDELRYLKERYRRVVARMVDSYIYFFDRALQLAGSRGVVGFVVPATLLNQTDAAPLRRLLVKRGLSVVVDLGQSVFTTKVLNTSAVIVTAASEANEIVVGSVAAAPLAERANALSLVPRTSWPTWKAAVERDPHATLFTGSAEAASLLDRLRAEHPPLSSVLNKNGIQRGVSPDVVNAHVLTPAEAKKHGIERELLRASLSGTQIKRYHPHVSDQVIIYTTRQTPMQRFSKALAFMRQFESKNTCKEVKGRKHPWWCLHRPRNPAIFCSPKFIGLTTTKTIEIIYDESENLFATDAMYLFAPPEGHDPRICLAILQSRLFLYLYRVSNQGEQRVIPQVKATKLGALPYPVGAVGLAAALGLPESVDRLVDLHAQIRSAGTEHEWTLREREIANVDRQIDAVVYEMYGLTPAEVAMVEKAA